MTTFLFRRCAQKSPLQSIGREKEDYLFEKGFGRTLLYLMKKSQEILFWNAHLILLQNEGGEVLSTTDSIPSISIQKTTHTTLYKLQKNKGSHKVCSLLTKRLRVRPVKISHSFSHRRRLASLVGHSCEKPNIKELLRESTLNMVCLGKSTHIALLQIVEKTLSA